MGPVLTARGSGGAPWDCCRAGVVPGTERPTRAPLDVPGGPLADDATTGPAACPATTSPAPPPARPAPARQPPRDRRGSSPAPPTTGPPTSACAPPRTPSA